MSFIQKWLGKSYSSPINAQDVQSCLIDKAAQENLNLEYKRADKIRKPDELTDTLSAFANSEGGLLVIGVAEGKNHMPERLDYIQDAGCTKEWVEQTIVSRVRPNMVPSPKIKEVKDANGRIFLIDVASCDNSPIMASDNRYYFRKNFSSEPMEHYMVAIFFQKIHVPVLQLSSYARKRGPLVYDFRFTMKNAGDNVAKMPFLSVTTINAAFEKSGPYLHALSETNTIDPDIPLLTQTIAWDLPPKYIHSRMSRSIEDIQINLKSHVGAVVFQLSAENMAPVRFCSFLHQLDYIVRDEASGAGLAPMRLLPIMDQDDFAQLLDEAKTVFKSYPVVKKSVKAFVMSTIKDESGEAFSSEYEQRIDEVETICKGLLEL